MKNIVYLLITLLGLMLLSSCAAYRVAIKEPKKEVVTTTQFEFDNTGKVIKKTVTQTTEEERVTEIDPFISEEMLREMGQYKQRDASARVTNAIGQGMEMYIQGTYKGDPNFLTTALEIQNSTSSQPDDRVRKNLRWDSRHKSRGSANFQPTIFHDDKGVPYYFDAAGTHILYGHPDQQQWMSWKMYKIAKDKGSL